MTETNVERWHRYMRGELPGGLDELLHPDCVFISPIVFTPQRGRELTKLYLGAAGQTLGGDDTGGTVDVTATGDGSTPGGFHYVKEIVDGNHAVLEFETSMGGTYVNGIDMLTFDDDGLITEFKVMIRPLQAIEKVHAAMRAMLEKMAPPPEG